MAEFDPARVRRAKHRCEKVIHFNKKRNEKRPRTTKAKRNLLSKSGKGKCRYCGAKLTRATATIDHVRPRSGGGYDRLANFVLACKACNQAKGSMSAGEFIASRKKASA